MKFSIYSCFILLLTIFFAEVKSYDPEIKIPLGHLHGKYLTSRDGKRFSAFLGIPYAEPPIRFESPKSVKSWNGTKNATSFGNKCPQGFLTGWTPLAKSGSEDCLYLNVYTPDVKRSLPVMVHFHGGAFMISDSQRYGADFYMDEKVVLVTLNYRLGALGFLSTGDHVIAGNFGLKDQNMALRWVQENIKSFGGDKDRVTIFGVSAGGASVSYHIVSAMSEGLFHRAISQSGSALNPWACVANPREKAFAFGRKVGCPSEESEVLANCLKKKTEEEIIQGQNALFEWNMNPLSPFAPSTEVPSEHAFLSECPLTMLKDGRFNKVPWMVTAAKDEGQLLFSAVVISRDHLMNELNEEWKRLAPITFEYDDIGLSGKNQNSLSMEISKFYFDGKKIDKSSRQDLSDLYSDRYFVHGIQKAVLFHAKHSPVYAGIFGFRGSPCALQYIPGVQADEDIVTHTDDIKFHHDRTSSMASANQSSEAKEAQKMTSKMLVNLWVQFVSGSSVLKVNGVTWPTVSDAEIDKRSLKWLLLDEKPKILSGVFEKRMKFWDDVLDRFKS